MKEPGEAFSPYLVVTASFVHFIVLQFTALLYALIAKGFWFVPESGGIIEAVMTTPIIRNLVSDAAPVLGYIGMLLFIYALLSGLASTFAIFRFSRLFETVTNSQARRHESHEAGNLETDSPSDDSTS